MLLAHTNSRTTPHTAQPPAAPAIKPSRICDAMLISQPTVPTENNTKREGSVSHPVSTQPRLRCSGEWSPPSVQPFQLSGSAVVARFSLMHSASHHHRTCRPPCFGTCAQKKGQRSPGPTAGYANLGARFRHYSATISLSSQFAEMSFCRSAKSPKEENGGLENKYAQHSRHAHTHKSKQHSLFRRSPISRYQSHPRTSATISGTPSCSNQR